jgi:hypothetical protein
MFPLGFCFARKIQSKLKIFIQDAINNLIDYIYLQIKLTRS